MNKITHSFILIFCLISINIYSQGTLEVTGNGTTITSGDISPDPSDNTDFGDVDTSSNLLNTFVLDNTAGGGSAGNRLDAITVSITGVDSADFVPNTTSFGNLTGNGGTLNLDITFTPNSVGPKYATVEITFTNGNSPYSYNIEGNGIIPVPEPEIDIFDNANNAIDDGGGNSPSGANNTDFGSTTSGSAVSNTYTIENNGTADLTLDDASPYVVITGDTGDFILTSNPSTPITASGNTTFTIEFDPTTTGTRSATVSIANNDADEVPYTFDIQGTGTSEANYIVADDVWNYYDNSQQPPNDGEGDTWIENDFNDGGWLSDSAPLGYGDMNGTALSNINSSTEVAYFRKTFTVTDHTIYNSLDLEAVRDDGIVVYVNGSEVWRNNMDPGAVSYSTFANTVVGGSSEGAWITQSVQNALVTGSNVVAVEVHQENAGSSDISFNFKLTGSAAVVSPVIRGPYLQSGTSSSIIIKWRTSSATDTHVNYGTLLGSLNLNVSDPTLTTEHEIELSGLTPNTIYYYELADSGGVYLPEDSEMYIKTAPSPGTDQFVRAWILGDPGTSGNGTYGNDQEDVRDAYYTYVAGATTNPGITDMMLFLGDNAYNNGTDGEYQAGFFDIYDTMLKKSVAWSCLGNHDGYSVDFNAQSGPYYDIFTFPTTASEAGGVASGTEEYYSFDYANIHFIILQSNNVDGGGTEDTFNTNQKNWLALDLAATTQDWIVALFHHPPYTKGSHDSDNDGENGLQTMREQYLPILEAGGVDLTLSGHSHSYERSKFVKGHYSYSNTFSDGTHKVGANGHLSGRADTADLAYSKTDTDIDGAVYITAGSSGKATGADFAGEDPYTGPSTLPVMYYSAQSLGSTIMEIENDGSGGQNMNVKFLRDTGAIDDYFTINKTGVTLSVNSETSNNVKLFPVPANNFLNIKVNSSETVQNIIFYNVIGKLVRETNKTKINVSTLKPGMYLVQIKTDKGEYFKNIIVK